MIDFTGATKVYSIGRKKDKREEYWIINQDTWYPVSRYTKEEAIADYESPKAQAERFESNYRAWCD